MQVTALVTRSGKWWAIQVPGMPEVNTQAAKLHQVEDQVADAVSLVANVPASSVTVDVRVAGRTSSRG